MAPRGHDRRADLAREIDERDYGRDLYLRVRPRQVHPHVLVAMQELLLRARPAVHHLGDVELVPGAVRPENRVADARVERVAEDLLAEHPRMARDARELAHAVAVEEVDRRVEVRALGVD